MLGSYKNKIENLLGQITQASNREYIIRSGRSFVEVYDANTHEVLASGTTERKLYGKLLAHYLLTYGQVNIDDESSSLDGLVEPETSENCAAILEEMGVL